MPHSAAPSSSSPSASASPWDCAGPKGRSRSAFHTIRSNAAREAWGLRARASNFAAHSRMAEPGFIGTGASLLGGASSVADRWLRYRRAGLI